MSALTFELWDSIDAVDGPAWDQLCQPAENLFMQRSLLGAIERSLSDDAQFWYVLFRDQDQRPVCAAAFSAYTLDISLLAEGFSAKVAQQVAKVAPGLLQLKVIFLGMPVSAGQNHICFAVDADRAAILKQLDELLVSKAREVKAECILAKEFSEAELPLMQPLLDCGYRLADSLPMNHMQPEHADFDGFLASLKSDTRGKLRKSIKKIKKNQLRFEYYRGTEAAERMTDEVYQLYRNVLDRAKIQLERLPKSFFLEMLQGLPDNMEVIFLYEEDRVLAFGACLFTDSVFVPIYLGVDYENNSKYDLYFNMLFETADRALKQGARDIVLGQSADDVKHFKLRSYQQPLYLYSKGISLSARLAMSCCFSLLFPKRALRFPRMSTEPAAAD
ncbi:hypothetical protein Pan241w_16000 [Gimesia alba]|uniref:BioF2-like acetyltransferase domain-containing protein n=1 Tax=Gimesia alba TaxID=2527973 RepID=A0A517RCB4_9PLAN|nr:GNAT family N-acetyltransferase [Gimesia alba]QDT41537.1 hypothetical protein Pan241w_16000 [Gimesia alba]